MIFITTALWFTGILVGLAFFLGLAERYLVVYGVCKINVNGGERTLEVQGGGNLLSTLNDAKVNIPSACGGKGSCGFCKVRVLSGGGPLLPTEKPFLSRVEIRSHYRLACQVKVKSDMEIAIPDFIETVKSMIANKTFNTNSRWRFVIQTHADWFNSAAPAVVMSEQAAPKVRDIVNAFRSEGGAVVPVLQEINNALSYLPEPALAYVAGELNLPVTTVCRIATFYNAFSLTPQGKHVISVCQGTACHVKGAMAVMSELERELHIKAGGTTGDMGFTLKGVRCIGCCGLAPVVTVGEDIHGQMCVKKVKSMVDSYRKETVNAQA